jgi:hypothetical protein
MGGLHQLRRNGSCATLSTRVEGVVLFWLLVRENHRDWHRSCAVVTHTNQQKGDQDIPTTPESLTRGVLVESWIGQANRRKGPE